MKRLTLIALPFFMVGAAALGLAFAFVMETWEEVAGMRTAPAEVLELVTLGTQSVDIQLGGTPQPLKLFPRVRIQLNATSTVETVLPEDGGSPPPYTPGDRLEVLYDLRNPALARSAALLSLHGEAVLFGLCGLFAFVIGLMFVITARRATARRS